MKDKNTRCRCLCVICQHHWVHSRFFGHESMIIQFATVQLWSAITGTQPDIMLPQKISLPNNSSLGKRKQHDAFQSDLPKYITLKDFPDSVCYCDIELFYLKDPQRKCDVFCAIIEFRNLKGGWAPFCGRMSMSARHHHVRSAHGTMQSHHSRS